MKEEISKEERRGATERKVGLGEAFRCGASASLISSFMIFS